MLSKAIQKPSKAFLKAFSRPLKDLSMPLKALGALKDLLKAGERYVKAF